MAILAESAIRKKVLDRELVIEPFNDAKVQPASYDLALGSALRAGVGSVNFKDSRDFILESNTWGYVASLETIDLPKTICARYGIPSSLARRGLIAFGGPQIDPGYRGKIFVSIYNPTLEPIILRQGDDFFTIIFESIEGTTEGYKGKYQDQSDFPSADVESMMRMRSKNLADVITRVETLDGSVTALASNFSKLNELVSTIQMDVHTFKENVQTYKPYFHATFWIIAVVAAAMVGIVLNNWFGK